MRRSILSIQSSKFVWARGSPLAYVCPSCRYQAACQRIPHRQNRRNASSGLPFTEKLRRRIWGTDNPPGMKDPYGGPGYFERRRQQGREGREGPISTPPEPEPAPPEPERTPIDHYQYATEDRIASRSVPENDPAHEDPQYVPAETWDGLERVGLSGHWREKPPVPEESFQPFLATFEKASTRDEILSSLHQAVVEVVTLRNSTSSLPGDLNLVTYTPEALASISSTAIELDHTGAHIVLKYGDGGRESILAAIGGLNETRNPAFAVPKNAGSGVENSEAGEDFSSKYAEGLREVETKEAGLLAQDVDKGQSRTFLGHEEEVGNRDGKSYKDYIGDLSPQRRIPYTGISPNFVTFPLESPELLFAIIRRVSQLTGHRLPDPLLTRSKTLRTVYSYLRRDSKPKPTKLAEHLSTKRDVASLPNVHIMSRRETPIDKDKQVGRWKVIEAELQSKGLPVLSRSRV